MRPTNKLFLFALIIFLLFGTVPAVNAQEPIATATVTAVETIEPDFATVEPVICGDPAESYDRSISTADEVDVYSIGLVADQFLTIDVDTVDNGATLDTILFVYFDSDPDDNIYPQIPITYNDRSSGPPNLNEDPYLELSVAETGTYYLVIYDATNGGMTGDYTLSLKCSAPLALPVKVGYLLGVTGSDFASLLTINPADATSTTRFPLGIGPIADIEFDPITSMLFVAIDTGNPGRIITIDPNNGTTENDFNYDNGGFIALESAGETFYGVYGYESADSGSGEYYSLVTIDRETGIFDLVASFKPVETPIESLAYDSLNNVLYGVSGIDLIQIDLGSFTITPVGPMTFGNVVSLDFDPNNSLYAATRGGNQGEPGKLFEIDHATGGVIREAGLLTDEDGFSVDVNGLTFVVGVPQDVDPIKTICSSTLTASASASSETAAPTLSRFKRKKNPLRRGIGLFKFEGKIGETVTINLTSDEEESVEAAGEESSASELKNSWLKYWKGKGRVFLGIRDSIPDVDFRVRKKDQLPLNMSATLPANGTYYVMLIRPLLRFYKADYCITLESDMPDSQASDTFDVAWPSDDSGDDSVSTSAAEPEDVQKSTETVASASADDGPVPVALSTTAVVNEPAADGSDPEVVETVGDETPVVVEPVAEIPVVTEPAADGGDPKIVQTLAETPVVVEPVAETPVVTEPTADGGDDTEVVQTDGGDTTVEEPVVVTVDKPVVVTPVEADPADDDDSGTDPADDDSSDEVGDDPVEDLLHKG